MTSVPPNPNTLANPGGAAPCRNAFCPDNMLIKFDALQPELLTSRPSWPSTSGVANPSSEDAEVFLSPPNDATQSATELARDPRTELKSGPPISVKCEAPSGLA